MNQTVNVACIWSYGHSDRFASSLALQTQANGSHTCNCSCIALWSKWENPNILHTIDNFIFQSFAFFLLPSSSSSNYRCFCNNPRNCFGLFDVRFGMAYVENYQMADKPKEIISEFRLLCYLCYRFQLLLNSSKVFIATGSKERALVW